MRLEKDDPRLMDYVLGELEDGEAQALAAALEDDQNKDARDLVEELRGVANTTRRILREDDAALSLRDEQRAAILGQAEEVPANVVPGPPWAGRMTTWLAVAAMLTVIAAITLPDALRSRMVQDGMLALEASPPEVPPTATFGATLPGDASNSDHDWNNTGSRSRGSLGAIGRGSRGGSETTQSTPTVIETESGTIYSSGFPGVAGSDRARTSSDEIVEARNRLEIKANTTDGLSMTYESGAVEPQHGTRAPEEEHWSEYNVGNLTGQTELPEQIASNQNYADPDNDGDGLRDWQWNTPNAKPTEIVGGPGTETYVKVAGVKPFLAVRDEPLSTFSIDVDTAAYSNVRRFLNQGHLPPPDAVRIEEMINYFAYAYPQPVDGRPFAVNVMGAPAPWAPQHRLVRIGIKGLEVPQSERPPANLVFLLDVSGSMGDANKLPLVKESMKTLLGQLRPNDRVAIVTYAGDARKVLDPTPCSERGSIVAAIDSLRAGGSTNGAGGIEMAYDLAQSGFIRGGVNRVILATDGDFNVGVTSHGGLMSLIEARAKSGVFLTALGFGMGNLKDATLEQLANRGNGNYAYIDNHAEARRALVDQLAGTLQTIAKDVKIQVEFNPARVSHYRLLGYENRALANRDFNDDTKDAGEIGAGHTVTALYEIIPAGSGPAPGVDPLKYQATEPDVDPLKYGAATSADNETPILPGPEPTPRPDIAPMPEWLTVKLRYKEPEASESTRLDVPLVSVNNDLREADADFRFASAVAAFGQVLRHGGYRHPSNFDRIIEMARAASNGDPDRDAFVDLVITAKTLTGPR